MASSDDDEDYRPPPAQWVRPKNFFMLKAKKKKDNQLSKSRFDCPECQARFPTKKSLKNHSQSVHGKSFHIFHFSEKDIFVKFSTTTVVQYPLSFAILHFNPKMTLIFNRGIS